MDFGKLGDLAETAKKMGVDVPDITDVIGKLDIPDLPTEMLSEALALLKTEGPVAAITHLIKELLGSENMDLKNFGGLMQSSLGDKVSDLSMDDATKILETLKK